MVIKRSCSFCAGEIEPGTGMMFVKRDGTVFYFCSSACRRDQLKLGRVGHRFKWTRAYQSKKALEHSQGVSRAAAPAAEKKAAPAVKKSEEPAPAKPATEPAPAKAPKTEAKASPPAAAPAEKKDPAPKATAPAKKAPAKAAKEPSKEKKDAA